MGVGEEMTWIEAGRPYLLMVKAKVDVREALVEALRFWLPEGPARLVADEVLRKTGLEAFGLYTIATAKEDEDTIMQRFREFTEPGLVAWPPPAPWEDPGVAEVMAVKVLAHKVFPRREREEG